MVRGIWIFDNDALIKYLQVLHRVANTVWSHIVYKLIEMNVTFRVNLTWTQKP